MRSTAILAPNSQPFDTNIVPANFIPPKSRSLREIRETRGTLLEQLSRPEARPDTGPTLHETIELVPFSPKATALHLYVDSDQHLTYHEGNGLFSKYTTDYAEKLIKKTIPEIKAIEKAGADVYYVMLGDLFDFLEMHCKTYRSLPFNSNCELVSPGNNINILKEIARVNGYPIDAISQLLNLTDRAKIVIITGNHDEPMSKSAQLRQAIQMMLLPFATDHERNERIIFANSFNAMGVLHGSHGHEIDVHENLDNGIPDGYWTSLLKNNVLSGIESRLQGLLKEGLYPNRIPKILAKLPEAHLYRDAASMINFIERLASDHYRAVKSKHGKKPAKPIRDAILEYRKDLAREIKQTPLISDEISKQLGSHFQWLANLIPSWALQTKQFRKYLADTVAKKYSRTHSHQPQLAAAVERHRSSKGQLQHAVNGHIHEYITSQSGPVAAHNSGTPVPGKLANGKIQYVGSGLRFSFPLNTKNRKMLVRNHNGTIQTYDLAS